MGKIVLKEYKTYTDIIWILIIDSCNDVTSLCKVTSFSLIPIIDTAKCRVDGFKCKLIASLLGVDFQVSVLVPAAAGDGLLQPGHGAARHPHRQHQGDHED